MNILFICKYNRFRSKVAEAVFSKLNKNKEIKFKSAGIRPDVLRPYVAQSVINLLAEKGYRVVDEASHQVSEQLVAWADKIVIAADNVHPDLFPREKREVWEIEDADESETDRIRKTIVQIEKKVKDLIKSLKV
jgi:protein-tyrosine-phosphatase